VGQRAAGAAVSHTFRYLVPSTPTPGMRVVLSGSDAHHLLRVVRRRRGDAVEVIDPAGGVWPAVVGETDPEAVLEIGSAPLRRLARAPVTLFLGLCEWGRLDVAVEKCTELGIPRLVIYAGQRSQRVPASDAWRRRRERLVRVTESAARQSGQGALPEIDGVWSFDHVCATLTQQPSVVLDPSGRASLGRHLAGHPPAHRLALVIGPDSGLDDDELASARAAGAAVCHLGDTTLRAETAAIVAASIALAAIGHLDGGGLGSVNGTEGDG
jgi:16S rRNA (uracil1498-N3)-methyltransferase